MLLVFLMSSCGRIKVHMASKWVCNCFEPFAEIEVQIRNTDDPEEKARLLEEQAEVGEDAEACLMELEERYGDKEEDIEFQDKVVHKLEKKCPSVYEIRGMAGFE